MYATDLAGDRILVLAVKPPAFVVCYRAAIVTKRPICSSSIWALIAASSFSDWASRADGLSYYTYTLPSVSA